MALRKYKNLAVYRRKMNSLLKLMFQNEEVNEMEVVYRGEVAGAAEVAFRTGLLDGVRGGIHNYTIFIDVPDTLKNACSFFQRSHNLVIEEINTNVIYSSGRISIYPWNRNDYEDNEIDLERRAEYFVLVFSIMVKWVENKIMEDQV